MKKIVSFALVAFVSIGFFMYAAGGGKHDYIRPTNLTATGSATQYQYLNANGSQVSRPWEEYSRVYVHSELAKDATNVTLSLERSNFPSSDGYWDEVWSRTLGGTSWDSTYVISDPFMWYRYKLVTTDTVSVFTTGIKIAAQ